MRTLPSFSLPRRARREKHRRRVAVPIALTGTLVATTLVSLVASGGAAEAATLGTYTIGATPVTLNQASDPGMGAITPTADATTNGMFGPQVDWTVLPLHVALARNGHLVSYGTPVETSTQAGYEFDDWDPSAGFGPDSHVVTASGMDYDAFCSALVELSDGRMLMVGGNSTMSTMIYDPTTKTASMSSGLHYARWYGTALRLTDGRILALGGGDYYDTGAYNTPNDNDDVAYTPEIGTGTGAWTTLTGAASTSIFGATDNRWWYPRAFNGPNGDVVGTSGDVVWDLSTAGTGSVTQTGTLPFFPGVSGSQVMYAPGKVLIAGGGQHENGDGVAATNAAAVVDFNGATPVITSAASMKYARNWLNLTVLPTGEVFANGGTSVGMGLWGDSSVKQSEIWNPTTGQWRTAATAQRIRTYHSTSLLMPSGAVFTGGGGVPGPEDNFNAEIYYPSYLFTKNADGTTSWAARPSITTIAGSAIYGGSVQLGLGSANIISSVQLISSPSVTHSENTDQRRIPLTFAQHGGSLTATLPASVNAMPPGTYELTVSDANGVPSAAQMITVAQGAAGIVTVGAGPEVQSAATLGDTTGTGTATGGDTTATGNTGTGTGTGTGTTTGTTTGTGTATGTTTAPTGTVPLTVDQSVGIESFDARGQRISRSGSSSSAGLRTVTTSSSAADQANSSWIVRPGLASASGVSFESKARPGYYLEAPASGTGTVRVAKRESSRAFAARATFVATTGATGQNTSFALWGDRSHVLRHTGSLIVAQKLDRTDRGRSESTFVVRAGYTAAGQVPLSSGRSVGLSTVTKATYRLGLDGSTVETRKATSGSSATLRTQTSWVVHTSGHGVRFESVQRPGYFLAAPAHGSGALTLLKRSTSASFAARTTFSAVAGLAEGATSLRLTAHPKSYLQASGHRLLVGTVSASHRANATFTVHSGYAPAPTR